MGIKFFGNFLVEREVITRKQLIEALEEQKRVNLKFGEHAVRLGFLKEEDIPRIRDVQKREDLKFGEAAIKLGLLTSEQVERIFRIQKSSHKLLGEILVEKGFITRDVLERELRVFDADQRTYMTETIYLPEGIKYREEVGIIIDLSKKFLLRVAGVNTKFGDFDFTECPELQIAAEVTFSGDAAMNFIFNSPRSVAQKLVWEYGLEETDENLKDVVKELTNMICGNTSAKLERLGKKADISHPKDPVSAGRAFRYKLTSADETVELYFLER